MPWRDFFTSSLNSYTIKLTGTSQRGVRFSNCSQEKNAKQFPKTVFFIKKPIRDKEERANKYKELQGRSTCVNVFFAEITYTGHKKRYHRIIQFYR